MCGIVGYVNTRSNFDLDDLGHRGPDFQDSIQVDRVSLGHTRLSIVETTTLGNQPYISSCGSYHLVFNGEIYNHEQLRLKLKQSFDISFESKSDTETVMHCLVNWGEKALEMFNGIFALAFFCRTGKKLIIARDRFGVKPLYYGFHDNSLVFSSELKALKNWEHYDSELCIKTLENYVRYLWSPGSNTPLQRIKKLLPGQLISIDLSKEVLDIEKRLYYIHKKSKTINISEDVMVDRLDEYLNKSLKRQLMADVPIGFFLSGGLDSSILVAIARKLNPEKKITCFTINTKEFTSSEGFDDDLYYAKKVAAFLNVDLIEVECRNDILADFDSMIWHLDEPQADAAPLNVQNISRKARELGFKVLIGGTAGDDLFSGYRRHQALKVIRVTRLIPSAVFTLLKNAMIVVPIKKVQKRRLIKIFGSLSDSGLKRVFSLFEWLHFDISSDLFIDKKSRKERFEFFEQLGFGTSLSDFSLEDFLMIERNSFLVDHNLNYTDKMGMAEGVEIRVPFLDNDLVDFAKSVPDDYKLRNGETKYLLKKVAERYLPHDVIYRSKTGFGAPVRRWVTEDLKDRIEQDLSQEILSNQGVFDGCKVQELISKNEKGKIDASYSIWALLAIQSWIKQFTS
jgi:asparagine synthase (glutamine-hydrolysing)